MASRSLRRARRTAAASWAASRSISPAATSAAYCAVMATGMVGSALDSRKAGPAGYRDRTGAATSKLPDVATLSAGGEASFMPQGAAANYAWPHQGLLVMGDGVVVRGDFVRSKSMI